MANTTYTYYIWREGDDERAGDARLIESTLEALGFKVELSDVDAY